MNLKSFLKLYSPLALMRKIKLYLQVKLRGGDLLLKPNLLINYPIIFMGKGSIQIGENVTLGYKYGGAYNSAILFQPRESGSEIIIGNGSIINNGVEFVARTKIQIGNNCLIGSRTIIYDSDFHDKSPNNRMLPGHTIPVEIQDNVWIGSNVIILKGVSIGKDSVIGAGSVVTRNIPNGSIAAGNPIRIIGSVYQDKANNVATVFAN